MPRSSNRRLALLPSTLSLENFHAVLARYPVLTWVTNSVIIAVVAVALRCSSTFCAATPLRNSASPAAIMLFFAILGALMVPIQVILVPEFLIVSWLGLLNTHLGVILPRAAEAFGIFMVRQFMVSIPDELLEAARLDGAGEFADLLPYRLAAVEADHRRAGNLHLHVALERLRLAAGRADRPGSMFTLPLGLNLLRGEVNPEWGNIMAMALLSLLPMLTIFLAFQRHLIQGIARTG